MNMRIWPIVSLAILIGAQLGCSADNASNMGLTTNSNGTPTASTTPPTVVNTGPQNGTTGYAVNKSITAIFSKPMKQATVTPATFYLSGPSGAVTGSVILSGSTTVFTPASDLEPNAFYTATITTGV